MLCFNKQLELIGKDINELEKILPYGNILLKKSRRYQSIGYELERNRIPLTWFCQQSIRPKTISIVQFIHRSFVFFFFRKSS